MNKIKNIVGKEMYFKKLPSELSMPGNQIKIDCVCHSDNDFRVIFYNNGKVQRYCFADFKTFYEYFQQMAHCLKVSFSKPLNY